MPMCIFQRLHHQKVIKINSVLFFQLHFLSNRFAKFINIFQFDTISIFAPRNASIAIKSGIFFIKIYSCTIQGLFSRLSVCVCVICQITHMYTPIVKHKSRHYDCVSVFYKQMCGKFSKFFYMFLRPAIERTTFQCN